MASNDDLDLFKSNSFRPQSKKTREALEKEYAQKDKQKTNSLYGFGRGVVQGAVQGVSDPIVSVLNAPADLIKYTSGHDTYHIDHPQWMNQNPQGAERAGQLLGQFGSAFVLPGGAASYAARGARALGAGRLAQGVAAIAGGAAEGALGNDGNRKMGAVFGGLIGGGSHLAENAYKGYQSTKQPAIADEIEQYYKNVVKPTATAKYDVVGQADKAGAGKLLNKIKLNDFKDVPKTKELKHIESLYNKAPSIELGDALKSVLSQEQEAIKKAASTAGRKITPHSLDKKKLDAIESLKKHIVDEMTSAMDATLGQGSGKTLQEASDYYSKTLIPYRDNKYISQLLDKDSNQAMVRGSLADNLLHKDKSDFLLKHGQNHPGLMGRKAYQDTLKKLTSKEAKIALALSALGTGGLGLHSLSGVANEAQYL